VKRAVQPFGNGVVQLRLITEADLDTTLAWRNREDVRVWFKTSYIIKRDQHRLWFAGYSDRDDDFLFVIEAGGQPVGQASVYGIDWDAGVGEVGRFVVAPEARGKGYIGLACEELLRFCGSALHLRSVFLEVKENNRRAIDIYVRSGFREECRADGMIRMTRAMNADIEGSR
jgi:RimJ/RimL family protein N-acetyltransferase